MIDKIVETLTKQELYFDKPMKSSWLIPVRVESITSITKEFSETMGIWLYHEDEVKYYVYELDPQKFLELQLIYNSLSRYDKEGIEVDLYNAICE